MLISSLLERMFSMDYLNRLDQAIKKEKLHEKYLQGKITTEEMEAKIREIGARLKKKKRS